MIPAFVQINTNEGQQVWVNPAHIVFALQQDENIAIIGLITDKTIVCPIVELNKIIGFTITG